MLTNRCRILVADDLRDAADALALCLELSGHEVRVAYGGESALSIAQQWAPDVAILDLGMVGLDGFALARLLRGDPGGGAMCLIAVTGWGRAVDIARATEAGFDHHFTKPVDPDQLDALIKARLTRPL